MAVNRYEAHKMNEILRGLLQGAYVFIIGVEDDEDKFVTVEDSEEIANRVSVPCDCFTICIPLYMAIIVFGIISTLRYGTIELNEDWNVGNNDPFSIFDFTDELSNADSLY